VPELMLRQVEKQVACITFAMGLRRRRAAVPPSRERRRRTHGALTTRKPLRFRYVMRRFK
jgi:hypothetical protein